MTYGPVDFIALEFQGNNFTGEILTELTDLVGKGIIRIIDLVVILKNQEGTVEVMEMQQLDGGVIAVLDPLDVEVSGILTLGDIEDMAAQIDNETTAALLLIENLWAIRTVEAMERANGRLLMYDRIPRQVIVEALEDIAKIESTE
jgi:uncharacterized membrane protein